MTEGQPSCTLISAAEECAPASPVLPKWVQPQPVVAALQQLPPLAAAQAHKRLGTIGGPGLSWQRGGRMHTRSQPAGQGRYWLRGGSLASMMQGAVMEQVAAWNPKPPLAFLPEKLFPQLRTTAGLGSCGSVGSPGLGYF